MCDSERMTVHGERFRCRRRERDGRSRESGPRSKFGPISARPHCNYFPSPHGDKVKVPIICSSRAKTVQSWCVQDNRDLVADSIKFLELGSESHFRPLARSLFEFLASATRRWSRILDGWIEIRPFEIDVDEFLQRCEIASKECFERRTDRLCGRNFQFASSSS